MNDESPAGGPKPARQRGRAARMGRAAAIAVLAALALALLTVLVVHLAAVRASVLRSALPTARERYGLDVQAARLDYNLATLRVALSNVRVAAAASDVPFLTADRLDVSLGRRVLL